MGTLRKTALTTVIPGIPGTPAVPPITGDRFMLWGTPPPQGKRYAFLGAPGYSKTLPAGYTATRILLGIYRYNTRLYNGRTYSVDGYIEYPGVNPPLRVNEAATMMAFDIGRKYETSGGFFYDTLASGLKVQGYTLSPPTLMSKASQFATWSPFQNGAGWERADSAYQQIQYVQFPGVPTSPNGYPLVPHNGPLNGVMYIPTVSGIRRYERQYYRDGNGYWGVYSGGYLGVPYTTTRNLAGLTMLANFPGCPAKPELPGQIITDHREGWNSGANSEASIDGDLRVTFQPVVSVAVVCGLCASGARFSDSRKIETIAAAFYFDRDPTTAARRFCVMESGKTVTAFATFDEGLDFVIERVEGVITYSYDGTVVHVSQKIIAGSLQVGSALFRAGDGIL